MTVRRESRRFFSAVNLNTFAIFTHNFVHSSNTFAFFVYILNIVLFVSTKLIKMRNSSTSNCCSFCGMCDNGFFGI